MLTQAALPNWSNYACALYIRHCRSNRVSRRLYMLRSSGVYREATTVR